MIFLNLNMKAKIKFNFFSQDLGKTFFAVENK